MANSSDTSYYGAGTDEWIGIVLPYKSQKLQQDGAAGFGIRRRVAIMGNHPNDNTISDDKIVFALVALPTTAGSGAAGKKSNVRVTQGDVVLGKFLDGENKQNPLIISVLGRSQGVKYGEGRFDCKTGFVGSEKVSVLNPIKQESSSDTAQVTPTAQKGSDKKTATSARSDTALAKSGIQPNKVGAAPPPPQSVFEVDEDGNLKMDISTQAKMKGFVEQINKNSPVDGVKMQMDGDVPDIGRYMVDVAGGKLKEGRQMLVDQGAPQEMIDRADELLNDPNWERDVMHDINKNIPGTTSFQLQTIADDININLSGLPGLGGGGGGTNAITDKATTKSLGKRGKDIGNLLARPFRQEEVDPRSQFATYE